MQGEVKLRQVVISLQERSDPVFSDLVRVKEKLGQLDLDPIYVYMENPNNKTQCQLCKRLAGPIFSLYWSEVVWSVKLGGIQ